MTEKLSQERLKKIEELFRNPPPNSKTATTEFGFDLSLLGVESISIDIRRLSQIKKS